MTLKYVVLCTELYCNPSSECDVNPASALPKWLIAHDLLNTSHCGVFFGHSELQKMRPTNVCPEPEWLPDACLGSMRQKSKKVFDECQLFFEETGTR